MSCLELRPAPSMCAPRPFSIEISELSEGSVSQLASKPKACSRGCLLPLLANAMTLKALNDYCVQHFTTHIHPLLYFKSSHAHHTPAVLSIPFTMPTKKSGAVETFKEPSKKVGRPRKSLVKLDVSIQAVQGHKTPAANEHAQSPDALTDQVDDDLPAAKKARGQGSLVMKKPSAPELATGLKSRKVAKDMTKKIPPNQKGLKVAEISSMTPRELIETLIAKNSEKGWSPGHCRSFGQADVPKFVPVLHPCHP